MTSCCRSFLNQKEGGEYAAATPEQGEHQRKPEVLPVHVLYGKRLDCLQLGRMLKNETPSATPKQMIVLITSSNFFFDFLIGLSSSHMGCIDLKLEAL